MSRYDMIKGIIPPIITPMNEDESFNEAEFRNQIERQIEGGVHGIFCYGTNEGDILNDLKYLESQGVDIVSCGTCLDFFKRKELLQVGTVTNMYDIVERMEKAEKIIKP